MDALFVQNFMDALLSFLMENSGKISAVLTLTGTVGVLAIKTYRIVKTKLSPYLQVVEGISKLSVQVESIAKQFEYDHGHSLKDQIRKIETTLERNTKITESIFNRQRWLMDTRSEPMFEADSKGNFTWANVAFVRLTKRGVADLLGNKWRNAISENAREDVVLKWNEAIKEKRNFEQTVHVTDKSGTEYAAWCVAALQDDGNYIGTFSEVQKVEKNIDAGVF